MNEYHGRIFALLLAAANIVFDYAKVRTVVEDRRSMLVALLASCRFIRNNPAGAIACMRSTSPCLRQRSPCTRSSRQAAAASA